MSVNEPTLRTPDQPPLATVSALAAAPLPVSGLRIGDAEREQASNLLAEHFAAGRLTLPEFTERSDAAASARSVYDLARLTADLPRLTPGAPRLAPVVPVHPVAPAAFVPGVAADVLFGIFGPLALVCLVLLLGLAAPASMAFGVFFGALGGAVGFGAIVHYAHRMGQRRVRGDGRG